MNAIVSTVLAALLTAILTWFGAWYWFGKDTQRLEAERLASVRDREAERLADNRIKEAARLAETRDTAAAQLAKDHQLLVARFTDIEAKLAILSQAVVPISTAFQAILIKELTHFHMPRMDELMVKVGPPSILTLEEESELEKLLEERQSDMGPEITDSERDAAQMLPMIIRRAKAEIAAMEGKPALFKLVMVIPEVLEVHRKL